MRSVILELDVTLSSHIFFGAKLFFKMSGIMQVLSLFSITIWLSSLEHSVAVIINEATRDELILSTTCTKEIRLDHCNLPNCRCSGEDTPGGLPNSEVPQLVFLTFDDNVNHANYELYNDLLLRGNRKNPNGEPITATFFVTHEYTNYIMVHDLWRHGNEIALHSITHRTPVTFWATSNESMWHQEVSEQRLQLSHFAKIPTEDIRGMRAPYLQGGGDVMYRALNSPGSGISWECSRGSKSLLWPYTNDFASTQDCSIRPCPKGRYPGFWTVPMVEHKGDSGASCVMSDSCLPVPNTANATFELLQRNFFTHYHGNRAPYGIFVHHPWIHHPGTIETARRKEGYIQFLDYLASLKDVYIVSISRALEWIKHPQPVDQLKHFEPFKVSIKSSRCNEKTACSYRPDSTERWLHSCVDECPKSYPWVGNPLGL